MASYGKILEFGCSRLKERIKRNGQFDDLSNEVIYELAAIKEDEALVKNQELHIKRLQEALEASKVTLLRRKEAFEKEMGSSEFENQG